MTEKEKKSLNDLVICVSTVVMAITGVGALFYTSGERRAVEPAPQIRHTENAPLQTVVPDGNTLEIAQRSTVFAACTGNIIGVTIGDITRKQVDVSVIRQDGTPVAGPRSMQEGEIIRFDLNGFSYEMILGKLTNRLAGEDSASFEVRTVARPDHE